MHIHSGQINPNLSATAANGSEAARRATATRKKLLDSASELQALSSDPTDSAWLIQAWADGQSQTNQNPHSNPEPNALAESSNAPRATQPTPVLLGLVFYREALPRRSDLQGASNHQHTVDKKRTGSS
jgi:hypothetical protein